MTEPLEDVQGLPSGLRHVFPSDGKLSRAMEHAIAMDVERALRARPSAAVVDWGDERSSAVAKVICDAIATNSDWPARSMIPQDELSYLLMPDLNGLVVGWAIEKAFAIRWSHAETLALSLNHRTLADLVREVRRRFPP